MSPSYPQSWTLITGQAAAELEKAGHTVYRRGDGPHHNSAICSACRKAAQETNAKERI